MTAGASGFRLLDLVYAPWRRHLLQWQVTVGQTNLQVKSMLCSTRTSSSLIQQGLFTVNQESTSGLEYGPMAALRLRGRPALAAYPTVLKCSTPGAIENRKTYQSLLARRVVVSYKSWLFKSDSSEEKIGGP